VDWLHVESEPFSLASPRLEPRLQPPQRWRPW